MGAFHAWLDSHWLFWPTFIILARVLDVSIGTLRTIMVVRGYERASAVLGFFEVVIWVVAVAGVLNDISVVKVIAYALGYALGNAAGIWLEKQMALGQQVVTVISRRQPLSVAFALRMAEYMVTEVPAKGGRGRVAMCFTVVSRRKVKEVIRIARGADPAVWIAVQDIRQSTLKKYAEVQATGWRAVAKRK